MKSLPSLALLLCATSLVAPAGPAEKGDKKSGTSIAGRYKITEAFKDGKKEDPKEVEGVMVLITKDTVVSTDRNKKQVYGATYVLDTSSTPWKISMTTISPKKGEKADGVVELKGQTLKVCYALPGGKTPTGFKTGEKQHLIVMERVKE